MTEILLFHKPYDVLCQFTDSDGRKTLADFIKEPRYRGFYPAGRLDRDSEGLLILTNDGQVQHRIAHPSMKLNKTYWVQVEGVPDTQAINQLQSGVSLKDGVTKPAKARLLPSPPQIDERDPPIRSRKTIPTSWLELTISEGKNRQVRRMTAAAGFPTLRLIRVQIGHWKLGQISAGDFKTDTVHLPASKQKSPKTNFRKKHKS
ncbi:pseudouridine synthase [Teredinibacter sp. KSP-S5-2]|uniref:pseudouridine synthase n=1 Tax=Teredinibacter sp. KSP-S5-2 TaxID=3034506 RepID=UPI00293422A0|nr:pseudouridine synthase [Teredinibacter sp. KSP-S5-2]WNO07555.1 pseudouridine synthase [Teredinibacter sp. KSP-S5-2]